ncbi:MAG: hypothetical protein P4M01_09395 [Acidobacteriota bacterium]|nr:hypothetical protein [Acidobacteriota bacterium]
MLHSISEVQTMIATGEFLLLAGSETALTQLPRGNWIAGTIPYFMAEEGGTYSEDRIFVTHLPAAAVKASVLQYTVDSLPQICHDAPDNGYSVLILPAATAVHRAYAENAPHYDGIFLKPIIGWVAGVALEEVGKIKPKVFDGRVAESFTDRAMVMHVELQEGTVAELSILNVFHPGTGDTITFSQPGFTASACTVNGNPESLASYIVAHKIDRRLPLTANYNGSVINVAIQDVNTSTGVVRFFAPVFANVEYRFAAPVADYLAAFDEAIKNESEVPAFSCNCILNYLYGELQGKKTGHITGPITFGEVAHQVLSQTLVRLILRTHS